MKPFTEQQVRFLQEIGDGILTVRVTPLRYEFEVGGKAKIPGRGLYATFDALTHFRGALVREPRYGNHSGWRVTDEAKSALAAQLARTNVATLQKEMA